MTPRFDSNLVMDHRRRSGIADFGGSQQSVRAFSKGLSRQLSGVTSAGSATRAKDAGLQVIPISATISVYPCRHLQHLRHAMPFDFPKHTPPVSQPGDGRMEDRNSGCLNASTTDSLRLYVIKLTTLSRTVNSSKAWRQKSPLLV